MHSMSGNPLFYANNLDQYLRGQIAAIETHVFENVQSHHLSESDDEIVTRLLPEARVGALKVDFENPVREVQEAQVQVSDQFRGGSITIAGIRATKAFPYTGHQALFDMKPNRFTTRLPYAIVSRTHVILAYEGRSDEDAIKREFADTEGALKFYVEASSHQVEAHDAALPDLLMGVVQRRRAQLREVAKIKDF
jgi:hypothetical protein